MQIDTDKITKPALQNWKSTAVGAAVLAIAALHSIHFDAAGNFAMTARDWTTVSIGVLAAIVGAAQRDAK